jgi:flagellar biosynthetic protein FliP
VSISAVFGVVAALAFVLALLGMTVWAMKRLGLARGGSRPGARLPVEVVQRVSLGPKLSIAVVRVGEKVMAVSIGDGAVHPLFEVSETDRDVVLETSRVAVPFVSGVGMHEALAVAPRGTTAPIPPVAAARGGVATTMPSLITSPVAQPSSGTGEDAGAGLPMATPTNDAEFMRRWYEPPADLGERRAATPRQRAVRSAVVSDATERLDTIFTPANDAVPVTVSARLAPKGRGVAEFQSVLRMALSGATRLAAVTVAIGLSMLAMPVAAQTATAGTAPSPTTQPPAATGNTPGTAAPATGPGARPTAAPAPTPRGSVQPRIPSGPPARDTRSRAAQPGSSEVMMPGVPPRSEAVSPSSTPSMSVSLGNTAKGDGLQVNGTVGVVILMGMLTLLPTLVLMMTGFTRIMIVLNFLKQAMGTQNAPPGQLVAAMALILTGFVMAPTIEVANRTAITPWLDGRMEQMDMLKTASQPFREFMLAQTRESDLRTFTELSGAPAPATPADIPLVTLMSAFTASELRTAFQIGFAIYLPFIVIDAVVASVLMSMGMMMLPPAMISMPFKLLLFVLVDGWTLVVESLVRSFK